MHRQRDQRSGKNRLQTIAAEDRQPAHVRAEEVLRATKTLPTRLCKRLLAKTSRGCQTELYHLTRISAVHQNTKLAKPEKASPVQQLYADASFSDLRRAQKLKSPAGICI